MNTELIIEALCLHIESLQRRVGEDEEYIREIASEYAPCDTPDAEERIADLEAELRHAYEERDDARIREHALRHRLRDTQPDTLGDLTGLAALRKQMEEADAEAARLEEHDIRDALR